MNPGLRKIPAVEKVLQALGSTPLPRAIVTELVRSELGRMREAGEVPELEEILATIRSALQRKERTRLQPVINATGVLIHTNLGRSPLGAGAIQALSEVAGSYSNLELDLDSSERGKRGSYVEALLAELAGAEAATVVNNCAAALVLALRYFTREKPEVIISRGELVQIGGGFRIPEILQTSGARLVEVGTTNQTETRDYAGAVTERTGLILKVHQSNFYMGGFVAAADPAELAGLARERSLPLMEDLGSGAVVDTQALGLRDRERTPAQVLQSGAEVVCFSGDKLFGGPQAGILAGSAGTIAALKAEPFFRALRCDKLVLAALQATAEEYLHRQNSAAPAGLPLFQMLMAPPDLLRQRAEAIASALAILPVLVSIVEGEARLGGGTLPRSSVPSVAIELQSGNLPAEAMAAQLRLGVPPVVGYISGGSLRLDLRTVFPEQDALLIAAVRDIVRSGEEARISRE